MLLLYALATWTAEFASRLSSDPHRARGSRSLDRSGMAMAAEPSVSRTSDSSKAVAVESAWEPDVPARAWRSIVLHHSATPRGDVPSIDAVHRRRKDANGKPWLGIGYHFVVGNGQGMADGDVSPTFRWRRQLPGAHAGQRQQNETGIGICLVGDFDAAPPTARQIAAVKKLIRQLSDRYQLQRDAVLRHSDVRATLCPGRLFPFDDLIAGLPGAGSTTKTLTAVTRPSTRLQHR